MTDLVQVSLAKGEVSPIAAARTDQAFYQSAVALAENFFIRAEGGASNRPGLEYIAQCNSTPNGSYLLPFVYNNNQAYLVEMSSSPALGFNGSLNIYLEGELVESLATPYIITDLPSLRWAQSADTLNLVVSSQPLYQLKRITINSFTMSAPTLLNGPFQDLNTDGTTYVYASGTQGTVTITASKGIFTPQHVGALFTIQEQFLNAIQPWTANTELAISGASAFGQYCRSNGKIYKCVTSTHPSGTTYTGTFQPVHTSGTQQDGNGNPTPSDAGSSVGVAWQFVSGIAGVALITKYLSATQVQAVVQSDKGIYSNFPPTVVGPPQTVHGPFPFTGDGSTVTFTGLTAISTGDPNQYLVTINGALSDPTTYSINQSGTSITFFQAPAPSAAISVSQVTGTTVINPVGSVALPGLPVSTYWAFGSLSAVQGYAATVVYFDDRLVLGGTTLQPQTLFTSKTGNYLDFGTSSPEVADDDITVTLNARRENPIVDLIAQADLLIGTSSGISRLTHSASSGSITPSDVAALPQSFYGQQAVPSVQTGDTTLYAQWGGRKLRDLIYNFQTDKYIGSELTILARQMFPVGTECTRVSFAPEPYGLVFCVRSDGVMCVCTYLPEQQITAWTRYLTDGYFEDVCVLPENDTFAVYVIVRRHVNGVDVRYIERFADREYATLQDAFFVDSGETYDGRQTSNPIVFIPDVISVSIATLSATAVGSTIVMQVTTAVPHNLAGGQQITISGVVGSGSYAINGNWTVSALGPPNFFEFTFSGSIVTGAYTSGGVVSSSQVLNGNTGSIVATSAIFAATDPANKNAVWINDSSGKRLCRLQITSFGGPTSVNVMALDPVPAGLASVLQRNWTYAKTHFTGLANLANRVISIYADGAALAQQTVAGDGSFSIPNAGGVVHAGLPYTARLKSMSPNIQNQPSIRDKAKSIAKLSIFVDESAPFETGPNFDHLTPTQVRQFELYGEPVALTTGVVNNQHETTLDENAVICIQQADPVPLTILGWKADLQIGESG